MTKIYCDWDFCRNNKDGVCQKDEIRMYVLSTKDEIEEALVCNEFWDRNE